MSSGSLALLTQLTARKLVPGRYRGLEQRRRLSLTVALRPCAGYVQPSRRVPDNRGNASVLLRTRRRRVRDSRNPSGDRTGRTPRCTCTLHLRTCACAALANLAVLDQGGSAALRRWPSVRAGLWPGGPARRTPGHTRADAMISRLRPSARLHSAGTVSLARASSSAAPPAHRGR